jgi:lipid A 4'-phosphatase
LVERDTPRRQLDPLAPDIAGDRRAPYEVGPSDLADADAAFAGTMSFVPWWQPGGDCPHNSSFVSGEASQAFWTVAPAVLAPPQLRTFALAGAAVFGASVSALRVAFGRHFVSDVIFSGISTVAIIMALYRLLLHPFRRNDAKLERGIERVAVRLHQATAGLLAGSGQALTFAGTALRDSGQHLHKRVAAL